MVPVLEGERVRLRGFTWADFPAFAAMWQEPEIARYIPFAPIPTTQNWVRFNRNVYTWALRGFGGWAVVDRADKFLGTIGLFHRPVKQMNVEPLIETGWVFASCAHGRGFASEGAALAHDWLDMQPFGGRSICMMDPEHTASIRVARKTGYEPLRMDEDQWGKVQLMERVRDRVPDVLAEKAGAEVVRGAGTA